MTYPSVLKKFFFKAVLHSWSNDFHSNLMWRHQWILYKRSAVNTVNSLSPNEICVFCYIV